MSIPVFQDTQHNIVGQPVSSRECLESPVVVPTDSPVSGAEPEIPETVLGNRIDDNAGQPVLTSERGKGTAVVSADPVVGAEPEAAVVGFHNGIDDVVTQPVLDGEPCQRSGFDTG